MDIKKIVITQEYIPIIIFIVLSIGLSTVILLASYLIALQKGDSEKTSSYECGFTPFGDARQKFDVRFYLVGILFLIFDLEVSFLFPWAMYVRNVKYELSFHTMTAFLVILTIGFYYEWKEGALKW